MSLQKSTEKKLNGSGPQGSTFGVWEYLAQSNDNANVVDPDYRYKFVDDLTVLEIVNLISVGLTSYNTKNHIPSDISVDKNFIPPQNLKSQQWLDEINTWTTNQKMQLNNEKTKNIIFNFTNEYQFSTGLQLDGQNFETI